MLSWAHIGDLHVADDDGWESVDRLAAIVDVINAELAPSIDFVFVPGDNANHGEPEQYRRIAEQLRRLRVPYRCIPGDHDFEPGDLRDYSALPHSACPHAWRFPDRRCLFLDIVSHGNGGPDFRLGQAQRRWLEHELADAASDALSPVVFMHAYPGDLAEGGRELAKELARANVALVDTGHTHYNDLLNDGAVVYAATRSTGQIEEDDGRAGFSIVQLDGNVASWRFQRLDDAWPVVMISTPADARLTTRQSVGRRDGDRVVRARVLGRAKVPGVTVVHRGTETPMRPSSEASGLWQADLAPPVDDTGAAAALTVHATVADGRVVSDTIEASTHWPHGDAEPGTDAWAVPSWRDHGFLGTRLGPNKGGRKW